jgi:hypothetical protein
LFALKKEQKMQALPGMKFEDCEGTLVSVENPALLETLVETSSLSRRCVPDAAAVGPVIVSLDSDDTAFVYGYDPLAFEAFLRQAYLATAEPQHLILSDARPLYDLLRETVPDVLARIPAVTLESFLRPAAGYPLGDLKMPFSRTDMGIRALKRGQPFSGMFSVCPYDGEPGCYSTYAWIEERICLSMAVRDGDLSLWLFPFRITGGV